MEEKETPESRNPAHKLLAKLGRNRESLYISRVPPTIKERFQELAEKEFCGDYGMLLKWLMDGIIAQDTRAIMETLEDHELRLQNLEKLIPNPEGEPSNVRTMLDGKTKIKVKGGEKE